MTDTPSPGPLAGLRVVDVGRLVAGPFAATLLGELGADVVKVEPVGVGDPLRSVGTIIEPGMSCAWIVAAMFMMTTQQVVRMRAAIETARAGLI